MLPRSFLETNQPIRIQLIITSGNVNGTASTQLQKNTAPSGGECTCNGRDEVFKKFNWTLFCVNWTDPDGIVLYQFYGEFNKQENCSVYSIRMVKTKKCRKMCVL